MLDITTPEINLETRPRIVVVGVGGAGGNAVENMISQNLEGCEFLVANTDAQALKHSSCDKHIQLGAIITKGLGAGANPEVGRKAAEESVDEVIDYIDGANMVFIASGMGGGTGTGAAPIIARHAREKGILTVGVVTKPFEFEGSRRMKQAEAGIIELQKFVDTLIIIPNQNLFYETSQTTSISDAFKMVDDVLHRGVRGVTDLMIKPGLINLDFNDIRTVMSEMGKAMMGTGEAIGEDRALIAAENAINNKLLDDDNMRGASAALINITASQDVSLVDVTAAVSRIREELAEDANIIFGTTIDETIGETFRISIVATGIDINAQNDSAPVDLDIERPQPDILFGEKAETSDTFLNALQGQDTQAVADTIDTQSDELPQDFFTKTQEVPENSTPAVTTETVSTQQSPKNEKTLTEDSVQVESMEHPSMHAEMFTEAQQPETPLAEIDPFFEADLANASHNSIEEKSVEENITQENSEKGGFFKRLFGGIKSTENTVHRTEPVLGTQPYAPSPSKQNDVTTDGNLALEPEKKTDVDMDIPAFLRKQIN